MGGSTLPLAPDAFSGRMLGKYEVLCRLSTGGMAEIFLASQRGLAGFRKLVVLKQILPDIKGEEEFVRMFLDEARVTAAFSHPNIAQVYDLDVADGELFLAMEFVQGATLVEVAKACRASNIPIPIGLSLASARDTALALHYAHTFTDPLGRPASVIHRDVAEKNIMVTYEGVTKLLDFGIAKNLARKSRTQVGMVKGTSGYMSPEQILGEPLDARSDLFSLGVVLHECLTGMRLFHAKTPSAGAGAVLHGQVPPPSRNNKAVPPELDAIVLKALSKKRDDRYASTLEFARALERAVGPAVWHPEQNAELIRSLFADRLAQTRKLLAGQLMPGEGTGEVRVSQLFNVSALGLSQPPAAPQPFQASLVPQPADYPDEDGESDEEGTQLNLPTITPALPAARAAPSPALTAPPAVKSPPPPPPEPQKPPTPPRGAAAPRRPTSTQLPVPPPPAPPDPPASRRPVFEPLPQKRGAAPAPSEVAPPPPPPPEETTNTQPSEDKYRTRPTPAWADENATRAAPSEEPRAEMRPRSASRETRAPGPEPRQRSQLVVDMHKMGTLPHEGPPSPVSSRADDEESTQQDSLSSVAPRQSPARPRITSNVSRQGSTVAVRPSRRAPTPDPESSDLVTHPVRVLGHRDEEREDTNETRLPDGEDGPSLVTNTTPDAAMLPPSRRGGVLIILAVLALLVLGGGAAIALGLDGGRISGLWASEPKDAKPTEPPKTSAETPPGGGAPAPAPEPAPTPPATASEPVAMASPAPASPTEPAPAAGAGTPAPTGAEAVALKAAALQSPEPTEEPTEEPAKEPAPEPTREPVALEPEPEPVAAAPVEEPQPPTRKKRPPTRRVTREQRPAEDNPPSDWAPVDEKPEAAEAAAPAGEPGVLTIVTAPYAKVYLGKRYLGDTPLFKLTLPSGKHTLRLVDPDGQNLRLPVEIKAGETTKVNLELSTLARE